MKESQRGNRQQSTKARIRAYLVGDEITLTADEIATLARWEKADLLYRQAVPFEEIIKTLTLQPYSVTAFKAQNDLFNAMEVFAAARKVNKKYLMFLKYQRQEQDIERYRKSIFEQFYIDEVTKEKYPVPPNEKQVMALAKLEEAATYTLNSMPQEQERAPVVPTRVMLHLVPEDDIPLELPLHETLKLADAYLKQLPTLEPIPVADATGSTGSKRG